MFAFLLCVFVAFERNKGIVGYIRRVSALVRRSARGSACKNRNASRLRDPLFLGRLPFSLQSGRFWLRIEDYILYIQFMSPPFLLIGHRESFRRMTSMSVVVVMMMMPVVVMVRVVSS